MGAAEREARKSRRRAAILETAIRIFAHKGFHYTRVSDIAEAAGVADGTIYLYFRSKDDILITIFEDKMREIIATTRDALEQVEGWEEGIRTFVRVHMEQVEAHPELATVLQVELRLSNKFMKEYVPVRLQEYLEILGEIVARGQEQGEVRADVNPVIVRRALFGALDEIAMQWVLAERRYTLEDSIHQVASMFIEGLRAR